MFSLDKRGKELAPKPGLFQLEIQKKKKKRKVGTIWRNLEVLSTDYRTIIVRRPGRTEKRPALNKREAWRPGVPKQLREHRRLGYPPSHICSSFFFLFFRENKLALAILHSVGPSGGPTTCPTPTHQPTPSCWYCLHPTAIPFGKMFLSSCKVHLALGFSS